MKRSLSAALILVLAGCGSDKSEDDQDNSTPGNGNPVPKTINLSGTWLKSTEDRRTRIDTGIYESSYFTIFKHLMDDTVTGVQFERCWEYGEPFPLVGVKTSDRFYTFPGSPSDPGYAIHSESLLTRVTTFEPAWDPGYSYESIETLTKISDSIEIDNGTFILNGPISVAEFNHACVWLATDDPVELQTLEFLAPYTDDSISFHFQFKGGITVGTYHYDELRFADEVVLDVFSNATAFMNTVGSNALSPTDVTVNITEATPDRLAGSFAFLGMDNQRYTGEFDIILTN